MYIQIGLLVLCFVLVIKNYANWKYSYWRKKQIPFINPSFPFGNVENPLRRKYCFGKWIQLLYMVFKKRNVKYAGIYIFTSPYYVPMDPEIIKNIMQKDFHHFTDRGFYYNEKDDPLSAHLFAIGGQKWRNLRTKLTPVFTSNKIKIMFDTIINCTKPMEEFIHEFSVNKQSIDIKHVLSCFTMDIIGSCAFGLECNSFKDSDSKFITYGRAAFEPKGKIRTLTHLFALSKPEWARKLGVTVCLTEETDFFSSVVQDTINYRRQNNISRQDMLQIIMELEDKQKLTIQEVTAQAFVFFLAGFETSSTTMTFCLYELSINIDVQDKLRQEISCVLRKHKNKITYETIMDMKYMSQVIDETLRKYPPVSFITRQCVKNYSIPDTDVIIEEGTMIMVPVLGLHWDPEYYQNPEKFDPERFSECNKQKIRPFTYIPFGEGPRICIGMRFGLMQTKVGLTCLLKNYLFSISSKTQIPIRLNRYSFILTSETPIWLDVQKIM